MSAPEHVLVMRVCRADMTSRDGFRWPESGMVEAPEWKPTAECGHGLHGWLWGEGDITVADDLPHGQGARWLVVRVAAAEVVDLRGKVKFPRGEVVFVGEAHEAAYYLATHGAVGRAIIHGASSAGNRGTATAGDEGTATAGDGGTATAGYIGTATAGDGGTATAGNRGTATAGDGGIATAGNRGTATAGNGGTATAGDRGTATAGDEGTATAGDGGTIQLEFWDNGRRMWRKRAAEVFDGGLKAGVPYRLDAHGNFVAVEAKS